MNFLGRFLGKGISEVGQHGFLPVADDVKGNKIERVSKKVTKPEGGVSEDLQEEYTRMAQ